MDIVSTVAMVCVTINLIGALVCVGRLAIAARSLNEG